jgi:hypothetical protein
MVAAPANCWSYIGLEESHWKTLVHMAQAYLIDLQMPYNFWFYAIPHPAWMMNAIPGKYKTTLLCPLCSFMVFDMMSVHGSLSSPCAIFIMKRMVVTPGQSIRHIPWTG